MLVRDTNAPLGDFAGFNGLLVTIPRQSRGLSKLEPLKAAVIPKSHVAMSYLPSHRHTPHRLKLARPNLLFIPTISPSPSVAALFTDKQCVFGKGHTPANVKLLLSPRQSRGITYWIYDVTTSVCLQFEKDRVVNLSSIKDLGNYDFELEMLTDSISLRWSFVFDPDGKDEQHLHSIFLKISESPTAGLFLQKLLSTRTDDLERPDGDIFSPIACKLDFADSRFSTEVLALVTEWVDALPRAETTFGLVKYLKNHGDSITTFISNTLPPLAVLAYVGAWLGYAAHSFTSSTKYSAAWILTGGALFLIARYAAVLINSFFERHIRRISMVPLFQLTAGDKNRMTKYMTKSQRSVIVLAVGGLLYGFFKTIGFYLASLVITSPFLP